jgi:hypothetical protein
MLIGPRKNQWRAWQCTTLFKVLTIAPVDGISARTTSPFGMTFFASCASHAFGLALRFISVVQVRRVVATPFRRNGATLSSN